MMYRDCSPMVPNNLKLIHGFELLRDEEVAEIKGRALTYYHQKSGAELIVLKNQDPNKLFSISFRTRPSDSSGLFHILEHCALAGSINFPLKETFSTVMKGSLFTFLNAYTLHDATIYPIASTNSQDYQNLARIYLDAVFCPLLSRKTFEQEGWHFHLKRPEDRLAYEGIVYSEMKGVYGDPEATIELHSFNSLFPDSDYRNSSFGIPKEIPTLTYEAFRAAHAKFYHPSNSKIVVYGDVQIEENLALAAQYLDQYPATNVDSAFCEQPRFSAPRAEVHRYDPGKSELTGSDGAVTINWLLPEGRSIERKLAWSVLSEILVESSASPLYKALIESGFGEELSASHYNGELQNGFFTTGLLGIDPVDAPKIEEIVLERLRELVRDRINPELIRAALDTVEFKLREDDFGAEPRGLGYLFRMLPNLLHGGDAVSLLRWKEPLSNLRAQLAQGLPVFEELIQSDLIDNQHRTRVTFEPIIGMQQAEEEQERERLLETQRSLAETEVREIISSTWELERLQSSQDSAEALALIPTVDRAALPTKQQTIMPTLSNKGTVTLAHTELDTDGISYLSLLFDASHLSIQELKLLPVLCEVVTKLGTDTLDDAQFTNKIQIETGGGGIKVSPIITATHNPKDPGSIHIYISGSALSEKQAGLLEILNEVINSAALNNVERLKELITEMRSGAEGAALDDPNRFVVSRARAPLSELDAKSDLLGGVAQIALLRELEQRIESDSRAVVAELKTVLHKIISDQNLIIHGTMSQNEWHELCLKLDPLLSSLTKSAGLQSVGQPVPVSKASLVIPGKVSYCAQAFKLSGNDHPVGTILVLTELLSNGYLWEEVRVKGKAYGGAAKYDPIEGVMLYSSWRDPNPQSTLKVFSKVPDAIERGISADDLNRAIIATIREIDAPKLPRAQGAESLMHHLCAISPELRQRWRDQVLATTERDLINLAQALRTAQAQAATVLAGPEDLLAKVQTGSGMTLELDRIV